MKKLLLTIIFFSWATMPAMMFSPIKQATKALPTITHTARYTHVATPANTLTNHMVKYIDLQQEQQRLQKELSSHKENQGSVEFTKDCMIIFSSCTLLADILHPNTSSPFLATFVAASQTLAISGALYWVYKPLSRAKMRDLERNCNRAKTEMDTFKYEALNPLMRELKAPESNDPHMQDLLRVAQKVVE